MRIPDTGTKRERQLKFAEAGVLFVLLLGLCVFLGVRYGGDTTEEATGITTSQTVLADTMAAAPAIDIVADEVAVETTVEIAPEPDVEPEPVTYAAAETAYHAGDYELAMSRFERYAEENPDNVWGLYMLGLSTWKAGDPGTADEVLAEARDLQPEHFKSIVNHARVLLDLDRDTDAQAAVSQALALSPDHRGARRLQARLYHRQGNLTDAVSVYEEMLAGDRDDVWALNNLGLILIEQEDFVGALPPLARAAGLSDAAPVHNNLGVALERTGHFAAAVEAYAAALTRNPDHARAVVSLARVEDRADTATEVDLIALAEGFMAPVTESDAALAMAVMAEPDEADVPTEAATDDDSDQR